MPANLDAWIKWPAYRSENQIYDYFKDKYGEWILYDPELNKNTYILWLLPILIFLIGGAIVIKNFKIRK